MLKLISVIMIHLSFTIACTDSTQKSAESPSSTVPQPAVTNTASNSQADSSLDCDSSTNEFGQPTLCRCQSSLVYNPITGKCADGGRVCTMAIEYMFNEKTGQCFVARDGCMASDLYSIGWRARTQKDVCKSGNDLNLPGGDLPSTN